MQTHKSAKYHFRRTNQSQINHITCFYWQTQTIATKNQSRNVQISHLMHSLLANLDYRHQRNPLLANLDYRHQGHPLLANLDYCHQGHPLLANLDYRHQGYRLLANLDYCHQGKPLACTLHTKNQLTSGFLLTNLDYHHQKHLSSFSLTRFNTACTLHTISTATPRRRDKNNTAREAQNRLKSCTLLNHLQNCKQISKQTIDTTMSKPQSSSNTTSTPPQGGRGGNRNRPRDGSGRGRGSNSRKLSNRMAKAIRQQCSKQFVGDTPELSDVMFDNTNQTLKKWSTITQKLYRYLNKTYSISVSKSVESLKDLSMRNHPVPPIPVDTNPVSITIWRQMADAPTKALYKC